MTRMERVQEREEVKRELHFAKLYVMFFISFIFFVFVGRAMFIQSEEVETPEILNPVQQITHKEIVWSKYTIRVWLDGMRKIVPELTENTVELRTRRFLDIYWIEYTFEIWKMLSSTYNVDYTLPVCIAWADSHLGNALKSKNNIGNVGNNDRGDTVEYKTLESWINAIYAVLNNRYLWWHTKLGELSNEGRIRMKLPPCGNGNYCYATSATHWSSNVRNCLSILKDKNINEDWQFRR